jgi:hypothetical protein
VVRKIYLGRGAALDYEYELDSNEPPSDEQMKIFRQRDDFKAGKRGLF